MSSAPGSLVPGLPSPSWPSRPRAKLGVVGITAPASPSAPPPLSVEWASGSPPGTSRLWGNESRRPLRQRGLSWVPRAAVTSRREPGAHATEPYSLTALGTTRLKWGCRQGWLLPKAVRENLLCACLLASRAFWCSLAPRCWPACLHPSSHLAWPTLGLVVSDQGPA